MARSHEWYRQRRLEGHHPDLAAEVVRSPHLVTVVEPDGREVLYELMATPEEAEGLPAVIRMPVRGHEARPGLQEEETDSDWLMPNRWFVGAAPQEVVETLPTVTYTERQFRSHRWISWHNLDGTIRHPVWRRGSDDGRGKFWYARRTKRRLKKEPRRG